MIKYEKIGQSKDKYMILECNKCKKLLVLPEKTTKETVESKGWYIEKKKCLALCPACIKKDEERRAKEKQESSAKVKES